MSNLVTRRAAAGRLFGALAGTGLLLYGQEYGRARDLVARVQEDLERAANFTRKNDKERDRYRDAQHHLSEFDGDLRAGKFDKGKLDGAIDKLKDIVKNNTLESHDRDALAQDLSDLRTLRDLR
jgi:hypothetical protein